MHSLILTILGIVLVAALSFATWFYGGTLLTESKSRAEAVTLINQGEQILSATQLYTVEHSGNVPLSLQALVDKGYLQSLPDSTAVMAAAGPSSWSWDPATQTLALVHLVGKSETCRAVNAISYAGAFPEVVPDKVDTRFRVQCYGGENPHTVVWNARPNEPVAETGKPRLCEGLTTLGHTPTECGFGVLDVSTGSGPSISGVGPGVTNVEAPSDIPMVEGPSLAVTQSVLLSDLQRTGLITVKNNGTVSLSEISVLLRAYTSEGTAVSEIPSYGSATAGTLTVTSSNCPASLAPGAACQLSVQAAPGADGTLSGELTAYAMAPDTGLTVQGVSGNWAMDGNGAYTAVSWDNNNEAIGVISFTIANPGDYVLGVSYSMIASDYARLGVGLSYGDGRPNYDYYVGTGWQGSNVEGFMGQPIYLEPGSYNLELYYYKDSRTPPTDGARIFSVTAGKQLTATGQITGSITNPPILSLDPSALDPVFAGQYAYLMLYPNLHASNALYFNSYYARWSLVDGQLPEGLTLNNNGTITGVTLKVGTYPITVRAEYGTASVEQTYNIVVSTYFDVLLWSYVDLPAGRVGAYYTADLTNYLTVIGDPDYRVGMAEFTASGVPAGLTLSKEGVLSGTPLSQGYKSFYVEASYKGITRGSWYYLNLVDSLAVTGDSYTSAGQFSNDLLYFYNLRSGVSSSQTLTVTNNTSGTITLVPAEVTGAFSVTNTTCGSGLTPGGSCTYTVQFLSRLPGQFVGSFTLGSNVQTKSIQLYGETYYTQYDFNWGYSSQPNALVLADVPEAAAGLPAVTIINRGTVPLVLGSPSMPEGFYVYRTWSEPGRLYSNPPCPSAIEPGLICQYLIYTSQPRDVSGYMVIPSDVGDIRILLTSGVIP